jgi:serine/threonine-protein kinase
MGQDSRTVEATPSVATAAPKDLVEVWLSYAPGERIAGKYQLIRKLDQGGMGVVWVAHHLGLDVHVALKLVRPEVDSPVAAERLVREAQAAARLRHAAIVQVLDVGRTDEGDPFLVMELLDGECLADVLDREGRLDAVTALRVILPVAGALEAMHAKGILHRDVKPDNVFLSRDDAGRWQPKLIDFGLARLGDHTGAGRITQRGVVVGTPVYLSPERLRGEEAGVGDDVWALCVVLYLLVTGEVPFEGESVVELLVALAGDEPSPLASHGISDPALWDILRRGLGPRSTRWPSMGALREALILELLKRGTTKDIAGLALGEAVPAVSVPAPSPPVRPQGRRGGWQTLSTMVVRPPALQLLKDNRASAAGLEMPTTPSGPAAESEAGTSPSLPAPSDPLPQPSLLVRPSPLVAMGLLMLGTLIGLVAGFLVWRR